MPLHAHASRCASVRKPWSPWRWIARGQMTQQASKRPSSNTLYLRRRKNRKFSFEKFMFGNIYRKVKRWENNYILQHNPLEGNYHMDHCHCHRKERAVVGVGGGGGELRWRDPSAMLISDLVVTKKRKLQTSKLKNKTKNKQKNNNREHKQTKENVTTTTTTL